MIQNTKPYRHAVHECAHWVFAELVGWPAVEVTLLPTPGFPHGKMRRVRLAYDRLWQVERAGGDIESAAKEWTSPTLPQRWQTHKVGYAKANLLIMVAGTAAVNAICGEQLLLTDKDFEDAMKCARFVSPADPTGEIQRAFQSVTFGCSGPVGKAIRDAADELVWRKHLEGAELRDLWEAD